MGFDIRIPIGSMFAIFGVILTGYGLVSDSEMYQRSLGLNVNLIWGLTMLIFGLLMLGLARLKRRKQVTPRTDGAGAHAGPPSERTALT
jgi:hypothetical protein